MTMRASLIITAKDQASVAFGRIAAGARRMAGAFKPVQTEAGAADRAIGKVGTGAMARFARIGAAAKKMASDMRIAERAGYGLGTAIGFSIRKAGAFALGAAKWAAIGAATAGGFFIGGIIKTASQFEQFQAQLEGTEGSAIKAKAAMSWVAKFAAQTPYQIDQVTDAFVRARGVGIDPLTSAMQKMGDAASANRKTLMDAVEAIADAQTGEFERLKAFNITTSVKGGNVSFAYIDKAGKNAVKTTRKNALDIQKAVLSIWDERHGGAMIRQSKTFAGIWSNLQDWVTGFQLKIAGKGIFDKIKNGLANILEWANRLESDGTLDRWAQSISDGLETAFNWASGLIEKTDWKKVGADLANIGRGAWTIAKALAWAVDKAVLLSSALSKINPFTGGLAGWAIRQIPAGRPEYGRGARREDVVRPALGRASGRLAPPKAIPSGRPEYGRASGKTADVKVGGEINLNISTAPGTTALVSKMASSNPSVPIRAKTGRAMAAAA